MFSHLHQLLLVTIGCSLSAASVKLVIYPVDKNVVLRRNTDLTLTCKILGEEDLNKTYSLSWIIPIKDSSAVNRVSFNTSHNTLVLTVLKLKKSDTGQYICEVDDGDFKLRHKISVLVNAERESCLPPFFNCGRSLCIPRHYVCDKYSDCPDGTDESFDHCGHDPCEGKILCDNRCIEKKYCCDPMVDLNCSVHYLIPCCQRYINDVLPMDIFEMESSGTPVQYKFHNLGFYQSTVYTMISCAIAFIFMSTMMLIAVCRIRMRHNTWFLQSSGSSLRPRFWHNCTSSGDQQISNQNNESRTAVCLQNHLNEHETIDPMENFALLTFDTNTGFQVAEYGPKPPPYAESNIGIPPPPYSSTLDISSGVTEPEATVDELHQSASNQQ